MKFKKKNLAKQIVLGLLLGSFAFTGAINTFAEDSNTDGSGLIKHNYSSEASLDNTALEQVKSLISENAADKDLSNISQTGVNKIVSSTANAMEGDKHINITVEDPTSNPTIKLSINTDGEVVEDNDKLVTGGTVYDSMHQDTVSLGKNSYAIGEHAIAIGGELIDETDTDGSTARNYAAATGSYATAIGAGAAATGNYSTALGVGSAAYGADSVAIGSYTVNSEASTVAIGHRRLTQVADAVKDTDAVNYGQLKDYVKKNSSSSASAKNITVEAGDYNSVTPVMDDDGNVTYVVNTEVNGKIESGNTGLVTGGDIHDYIEDNTVNKDLSNISDEAKETIKELAGSSIDIKTDDYLTSKKTTDENGNTTISIRVNADGKAEKGNQGLITGDTLYDALKDIPTNANLGNKANTDLDNLTDKGVETIKDIAKDSVKVIDGDNTTVTKGTDIDGNTTYQIHVDANGKIEEGNTDAVSGNTVKKALDEKVDLDASNLTGYEKAWADKLGVGKIEKGNDYLVTGDTVFNGVNEMIKENSLVKSDGLTISVSKNDTATKVDFSGIDKDGNTVDRVLTGIKTDANDAASAANVGYVNQATEGIYRDLDSMKSELRNEINDATAKAGAIAALHPQEYDPEDKLDFAAGYGTYKGANAAALGVFYRPNENITVNLGATVGAGDPLVTAGVSMKLGKGSGRIKSRNEMSKEIKDLKSHNKDLEEEVAYLEDQMHVVMKQLSALSVKYATEAKAASSQNDEIADSE